ncbi:MAG: SAM-dependent methyltransferase [Saprospiraceae bacterium]|nr:SAM-dependent methyltransferase [Saprospiraceae bacterium]
MKTGTLYLLPIPLGEDANHTLPEYLIQQFHRLDYFVAERAKTARRFLKEINHPKPMSEIHIEELNKHSQAEDLPFLLKPALEGHDLGLLSEAGCPGVADPGAQLIQLAHNRQIKVFPMVGPSSILLALMASGMNGQQFCFNGYLPQKKPDLIRKLQLLEKQALKFKQTQLFIETPYRNGAMFEACLEALAPNTRLCIACDLTLPTQYVRTCDIADWKKQPTPELHKRPAVFLLGH